MKQVEWHYPSDPKIVFDVRRRFEEFARTTSLSGDELEDLKVALSEACANAICHGSPRGPQDTFCVTCSLSRDELILEVADEGGGFARGAPVSLPTDFTPSGRGIFLMERLCDRVEVESRRPGTRVRLVKRLPRRRPAADRGPAADHQASAQPSRRGSLPPMNVCVPATA